MLFVLFNGPFTAMILHQGPINHLAHCRHGLFLYNRQDVFIGRSMEIYGEYSELELQLLTSLIRAGDVVIEVGANIGTHTVPIAQHVGAEGRVWAFEPQSVVYQTLCANLALNSVLNVRAIPNGVAAEALDLGLPVIDYSQPANYGGIRLLTEQDEQVIHCVSLDDVVDTDRLALIKIDVEGMECEVLRGANQLIQNYRPLLSVENDLSEQAAKLIDYIRALDYRMFNSFPPLFNPNNFRGYSGNIFEKIVSSNLVCVPDERVADFNLNLEEIV
ncbi:MAG: FkbM family methyltransferase [Parasphingorhabdus sp.]